MTGHQQNPGTGYTLMGEPTVEVDIPLLCKAIGLKEENIYTVNPLRLKEMEDVLTEALSKDEATVIIAKWPCILKRFSDKDKVNFDLSPKRYEIDQDKCTKCKLCVKTGCPAVFAGDRVTINPDSCNGCSVCAQVCAFDAIREVK